MFRFQPVARRLAVVAAGAVAGLASLLAAAAPAHADGTHTTVVVDNVLCAPDGVAQVRWHLHNDDTFDVVVNVVEALPAGSTLSMPPDSLVVAGGDLFTYQTVPVGTSSVHVTWHWSAVGDAKGEGDVTGDDEFQACRDVVDATFSPNCDGTTNVHLVNDSDKAIPFYFNRDHTVTYLVEGGATRDVPNVGAKDGKIYVDAENTTFATYEWVAPAGCPKPSLPVTGASLTGVVVLGGGLLVGGTVILAVLRRRARHRPA